MNDETTNFRKRLQSTTGNLLINDKFLSKRQDALMTTFETNHQPITQKGRVANDKYLLQNDIITW